MGKALDYLLDSERLMFWSKWKIEEVIDAEMLIIDDVVEEDIGRVGNVGSWPVVHGDTLFFAGTLDSQ